MSIKNQGIGANPQEKAESNPCKQPGSGFGPDLVIVTLSFFSHSTKNYNFGQ